MLRMAAEYLRLVSGQVIAGMRSFIPTSHCAPSAEGQGVNPRDLYSDGNLEKE